MFLPQKDQRSFHRMEINLPILLRKDGQVHNGICIDLSSTGMRIEFQKTGLHTGDQVDIYLNTDDERFLPLKAVAKLLRVSEYEDENFAAAVEFVSLA